MNRRRLLQVVGAGLSASVAGCTASSEPEPDGPTVELTDRLTFEPKRLEIEVGETVTWTNTGSIKHSVTAFEDEIPAGADYFASGGFEREADAREAYPEGAVDGAERYEHAFETPGTYRYFCVPHANMTGTIVVSEK